MAWMREARRAALVCLGLVWLAGCAAPSEPERMWITASAAPALGPGAKGYHSFRVADVSGGADTGALGLSEISNDALRSALEGSLGNLGYLAPDKGAATYRLSADLVDLDRPTSAYDPVLIFVPVDLTVTVRIHYTVTPVGADRPVFDDVVATTGTASVNDAVTPAMRVQRANEAAMRLNIVAFLQRLQTKLD